jgi:ubiquinone/menaquinone biosynthesis C-methylase UbiE
MDYDKKKLDEYEDDYFVYAKEKRGVDLTFYGNWQKDFGQLIIDVADLGSVSGKSWEVILDVGCATALNLRAIDELNIFKRIYGVDISKLMIHEMIEKVHADYEWNADTTDFYCTPSHDLSMIEDGDVDLILCTHTFEHIENEDDLDKTLEEFKRVLHKEGKLVSIIPCMPKEKVPLYDKGKMPNVSVLHKINKDISWWTKKIGKYFKSESFKARQIFKKTELKPDRDAEGTFYEVYTTWDLFRHVHK